MSFTITPGVINIDIYAAGTTLLNLVMGIMQENGIEMPDRTGFLPGGQLAFDDEQFTVQWITLSGGYPGSEEAGPVIPPTAMRFFYEFELTLLRYSPVLGDTANDSLPEQQILTANAATLAVDAENLLAAIIQVRTQELILPRQAPFAFGPLASIGPEGLLAGCRLPVKFPAGMSLAYNF